MAVSGEDRLVDSDAALPFARRAGSIVDVKVYPQAYHELLLEPEWRQIVEELASWLVARLRAPYT
jgi:alpha-beta hydrolase superfamily lysophospholipase